MQNRTGLLTSFAYRLVTTRESESVDGKLIADGAAKLGRNVGRSQEASCRISEQIVRFPEVALPT